MPRWASGRRRAAAAPGQRRVSGVPALLSAIVLLGGAALLATRLDPLPPPIEARARAVDGDTLRLNGERIRLLGIDAPELAQTCTDAGGGPWSCGEVARRELAGRVAGGAVRCEPDGHDKYGRVLAYCAAGGQDLGAAMVRAGLAVSYPDYGGEEAKARAMHRGIWQGPFVMPREWRASGGNATPDDDPPRDWATGLWSWLRQLTGARSLR
jgi:endonuclease YncB( thermonuclease family)